MFNTKEEMYNFLNDREFFFELEQYFNVNEYLKYLYIHHQVKEKNENPYK